MSRELGDLAAAATAFASFLEFLPAVAAGISIVWYIARFFVWARQRWRK